ncbi:TIGR03936 family radical SAM-associated protein [Phytomonospora endophytica]|uniref:Radical SAM-linked protein n=1 Tax=Phytomonospora endophytica TaxID=714109 RepID=A0A841FUI7_9ACTN|nr:TIGR03936 family radical SAM-associated protein [Phytomonospora endophytica]MBB6040025.1 radical SAM-linked protein [Phytomonospora endophytica]GIG65045.1 radical SAM protein [Phytomonospora endophytica]
MARVQPEQQAPVVQRIRIRYAKRGPLRFTSHRDFARALERAVRRARLPIAYSSGFHPHPRISYTSAAPTGVASEAEYAEIALQRRIDPADLVRDLDAALPPGLDVLEAAESTGGSLDERLTVSHWRLELPGVTDAQATDAITAFLNAEEISVQRMTKKGYRTIDPRQPVLHLGLHSDESGALSAPHAADADSCAILDLVVQHVTPSVRPDDVLAGLRVAAGLEPPVPPRVTRLAQGMVAEHGEGSTPFSAGTESATGAGFALSAVGGLADPLGPDRGTVVTE